jgi:hypothetical protein
VIDDAVPRGNGNAIIEAGEEIWYTIELLNAGQDALTQVDASLRVLRTSDLQPHPLVTVIDDTSVFGAIQVGEIVTGDRLVFALDESVDPNTVLLEITYENQPHADVVELLDVLPPAAPDSMRAFGSPSSITLKWSPPADDDILGYDVYRTLNPFGTWDRVNTYIIEGSSIYEDHELPSLQRYYYYVV